MIYLVWLLLALMGTSASALDLCPRTAGSVILSGKSNCPTITPGGGGGGGGTVGNIGTFTANRFILGAGGLNVTESTAITGLVVANGASAPTAYGGGVCTNQFVRSVSATGALTCAQVSLATDVTGTLAGTQTPAYTGDVTKLAGSLTTTIANGVVTDAKIAGMAASKLTGTLPAAQFPALTGNVTTTAGGLATTIAASAVTNAMLAGGIDLATKVTGVLPAANGGTGNSVATDDAVLIGNGLFWQAKAMPDCQDIGGQHLNYVASSNSFACGTSTSGLTPVTAAGTLPADELIVGNGGAQVKTATAPIVVRAEDTSVQFSVTATQNAANYIETQAALSGIGPTVAATSVIDTDVDLGLVGQGAGCVNLGNGDFSTPLLRACSTGIVVDNVGLTMNTALSAIDSGFTVRDDGDPTKKLAFELSGVSTGTTRTLTVPNASTTLVGTDTTDTLTNKTLTTPTIASFANAGHTHTNSAGGGQLTDAALSAAVGVAKGGTNQTSYTKGDILVATGSTTLTKLGVGSDNQVLTADAAQASGVKWAAGGGGGSGDMLSTLTSSEISITGATTATISRMHVCSGTSADYTVTLPTAASNAGKFIGFRMATGLTKIVTLDGNGSETIDGATTRLMWAGEAVVLMSDGSNWARINGKSLPMMGTMLRSSDQSIGSGATDIHVETDTADVNVGGMVDTTNFRFNIRRPGTYRYQGHVRYNNASFGADAYVSIWKNGTMVGQTQIGWNMGSYGGISLGGMLTLAASDYVELYFIQYSGSARTIGSAYFELMEVVGW